MTTLLFLIDDTCSLGGSGQKQLSPVRGTVSKTAVTNTVTSGTNIPVTLTAGGTAVTWWYQVNAVTISGNISANIRGSETALTANAGAGILIERYDSTGTTLLGTILSDRTVPSTITEYAVADGAKALAAVAPTSTAMSAGDWIKVTLKVRNFGTMSHAASETVSNSYNGPTAAAAGDTSVTFAETITPYIPSLDAIGPSSAGGGGVVSPATYSHVCGGAPTLLLAAVIFGQSPDTGVTSWTVSYGGFTMTPVGSPLHSGTDTAGYLQWYKLKNPPTGTNTFSATATGASGTFSLLAGSVSFKSPVADVGTLTTNANTTGTPSAAATLTVTGHSGFPVIAALEAGTSIASMNQFMQMIKNLNSNTAAGNFGISVANGISSNAFRGTLSGSDEWGMAGFELVGAAGGAQLAVAQKGVATKALGMKGSVLVNAFSK